MKRLLVVMMVLVMGLAPLRAQSSEQPPQDCAIVAAEYICRLHTAGIPAMAIGLGLRQKLTGKRGGHVVTLWQPCSGGDYYISDRRGTIKVPCLPTDNMDAVLKAIQKLVNENTDTIALTATILW